MMNQSRNTDFEVIDAKKVLTYVNSVPTAASLVIVKDPAGVVTTTGWTATYGTKGAPDAKKATSGRTSGTEPPGTKYYFDTTVMVTYQALNQTKEIPVRVYYDYGHSINILGRDADRVLTLSYLSGGIHLSWDYAWRNSLVYSHYSGPRLDIQDGQGAAYYFVVDRYWNPQAPLNTIRGGTRRNVKPSDRRDSIDLTTIGANHGDVLRVRHAQPNGYDSGNTKRNFVENYQNSVAENRTASGDMLWELTANGYRTLDIHTLRVEQQNILLGMTNEALDANCKKYLDTSQHQHITIVRFSAYPDTSKAGMTTGKIIVEEKLQTGNRKITWEYLVPFQVVDVKSQFLKYGSTRYAPVSEYGAVFLNGRDSTMPLYVRQVEEDHPVLDFNTENVLDYAGRAEKLVRLQDKTGLPFEQLDWLIVNGSDAVSRDHGPVVLNTAVLYVLAEYIRLSKRYDISPDVFVTFIGKTNPYAKAGQKSLYETMYSSTDGAYTIPLDAQTMIQFPIEKQGQNEKICCGAYGITGDEFRRIGDYLQENVETLPFNTYTSAQMYRLVKIPQMVGLRFMEGEMLLKLMAGGQDTLLRTIASGGNVETLAIIRKMEIVVDWMNRHDLTVFELNALITDQYNTTATSDIYNFLYTVYHTASQPVDAGVDVPKEQIITAFAQSYHVKANVMTQIVQWLSITNKQYGLKDFWLHLTTFFGTNRENASLDALEKYPALLQYCQQLSQYVLISKWAGLSELDLLFITEEPNRLFEGNQNVPAPSLGLLLLLSRLVEWQKRTKVGTDEAMRYFEQANQADMSADLAATTVAHIEGWNAEQTKVNQRYLFGEQGFATNFEQLYTLETWIRLGSQLHVSSKTISDLMIMSGSNETATDRQLIKNVANNLMAAARDIVKKGEQENDK